MRKQTFWNEASRAGAIIGGIEVLGALLAPQLAKMGGLSFLLSVVLLTAFIVLNYLFTKRRALLYGGEEGYTYGNGLRFMLTVALFTGVLCGAYEIVARNWIYPAYYRELSDTMLVTVAQTKLYTSAQLAEMKQMYQTMLFSPLWVVLASILGQVIKALFFGLFIAAFTKREPEIFSSNDSE